MSDTNDDDDSRVHETRRVDAIPFDGFHKKDDPAILNAGEVYWRDRQEWLAECGYLLRGRYNRNWRPSWERRGKHPRFFEDGWPTPITRAYFTMDAMRGADRKMTLLKRIQISKSDIPPEEHPEVAIMKYFSNEDLMRDPENHCVPLYDVLSEPDTGDLILVTPFLRPFDKPRFLTVGEVIDFIGQILEGLDFMHRHDIAHRNCTAENIMMDGTGLYPDGFHPVLLDRLPMNISRKAKHYSRTEYRPTYYLCNFALSQQFDPSRGPPSAMPEHASDRSVPEFQGAGMEQHHDPFATDVYLIGNMIKSQFVVSKYGFDFLFPLVESMTRDDPTMRPTIDRVVLEFDDLRRTLRKSKLRSRVISKNDLEVSGMFNGITHLFRTMKFAIKGIPPASSSEYFSFEFHFAR
ncbi:hypothetical protein BU17DRAFT_77924 [Hysterangium stoloniferum]|nr:hypothetical protein BU17DRAFT_77924 [Hysterangium stoloniferum]